MLDLNTNVYEWLPRTIITQNHYGADDQYLNGAKWLVKFYFLLVISYLLSCHAGAQDLGIVESPPSWNECGVDIAF